MSCILKTKIQPNFHQIHRGCEVYSRQFPVWRGNSHVITAANRSLQVTRQSRYPQQQKMCGIMHGRKMDLHPSFQKGIPKLMDKFRMNIAKQYPISKNKKNDQSTKLCNLVAKFWMFPMHPETPQLGQRLTKGGMRRKGGKFSKKSLKVSHRTWAPIFCYLTNT